jgi:hypothetical protein
MKMVNRPYWVRGIKSIHGYKVENPATSRGLSQLYVCGIKGKTHFAFSLHRSGIQRTSR